MVLKIKAIFLKPGFSNPAYNGNRNVSIDLNDLGKRVVVIPENGGTSIFAFISTLIYHIKLSLFF